MKPLRTYLALAASLLCLSTLAHAAEWQTDYNQALAQAAKEKKFVLLNFTGSDWCGYCMGMTKSVFSLPEFQEFADQNLVLVEIDFPRDKPQSPTLKAQNKRLEKKYKVEGYPTIFLLDSHGRKVADYDLEKEYDKASPATFAKWVKKYRK